jgi:hypothetical protein
MESDAQGSTNQHKYNIHDFRSLDFRAHARRGSVKLSWSFFFRGISRGVCVRHESPQQIYIGARSILAMIRRTGIVTFFWCRFAMPFGSKLRYEHARDAEAYDNPTQTAGAGGNSQVMSAADAIFHF